MMPIMFAMFALSFSVGLSVYFVVGNLVSIAQYTFMGKAEWRSLFGRKKEDAEAIPAVVTSTASNVVENQPITKAEKRKNKKMRARDS
jgi:YidC/Oxa1 family membrane protein insertase